jgi:hypothetical protein
MKMADLHAVAARRAIMRMTTMTTMTTMVHFMMTHPNRFNRIIPNDR